MNLNAVLVFEQTTSFFAGLFGDIVDFGPVFCKRILTT